MNAQRRQHIVLRSRMLAVRMQPFDRAVCLELVEAGQGDRAEQLIDRVLQLADRVQRIRRVLAGGPMPSEGAACYVAERDLAEAEALLLLLEAMRDGLGAAS